MFFDCDRCLYRRSQLVEVLCQLRFPTILSISAKEPAEFQDAIRKDFPQYKRLQEMPAPKVSGAPGNMRVQEAQPVTNYQFVSADGKWKVNLTNQFVSLATTSYTKWEDFAAQLDKVLAQFIPIYQPAYFERVGLRFINVFSRRALGVADLQFRDLFQPGYLGLLAEEDVNEAAVSGVRQETNMSLSGGCTLKMQAGTCVVQKNGVKEDEVKFMLDNDVFMLGNLPVAQIAPALQTAHLQADRIFRGAITQTLHDAMEPLPLD